MTENLEKTYLEELRSLFKNSQLTDNSGPLEWMHSIRDKLFTMFCSPLKDDFTLEAFKWVSQLCVAVGDFSWISAENRWTRHQVKVFSCISRLSINEIRIVLPLIERHLTLGDEVEEEAGKIVARSAGPDDYDKFGIHLTILESAIRTLVEDERSDQNDENCLTEVLEPRELRSLLDELKSMMNIICDYLELVHRRWSELVEINGDKLSSAEGALRLMSVWISDEPDSFKKQCDKFLVDLLVKALNLNDRPSQHDLYILALHSVCTPEKLEQVEGHRQALENYLERIKKERSNRDGVTDAKKSKMLKLRCGLVKDLLK